MIPTWRALMSVFDRYTEMYLDDVDMLIVEVVASYFTI